jgi:iron complex outermembrane receptor protein
MRAKFESLLACTASCLALAAGMPALGQPAAQAVDTMAETPAGIDEIVVTARRRAEKAQTVPIVIDTFSQQALEEQDIREAQDLSHNIPGLTIVSSVRGMSSFAFLRGVPGVITYFADVPTVLAGGALYFDLDNVQALKGPQGTLFGLNADAGAILFEPKRPTDRFEGYGQVTVGDYNRHGFEGVVNLPLTDKLTVRAGIDYNHTDGFQYDRAEGQYVNNDDYWIGRLSATMRPTDDFTNYIIANYYYSDTNGADLFPVGVSPTGYAKRFFPGLAAAFAQQQQLGPYDSLGSAIPGGMVYRIAQWNVSDIATYDLSDAISLKNIAGYTEVTTFDRLNFDGVTFPIYDVGSGTSTASGPLATYSDELQLQGKSFGDRLTWVVGSFLSFNHQTDPAPQYSVVLGSKSGTLSATSGRTQAIYGQGTYDLSQLVEGLSFTAGYRYSWDSRSAFQNSLNAAGQTLLTYAATGNFHAPGYTFSLDYQSSPDTLFYVSYSKAYSSGGFNLAAPPQFQKFNPEYLSDVEAGVKSDWEWKGIKARTNFGGFYGWYDSIQAPQSVAFSDATGTHFLVETLNAATAHIEGLETELTLLPLTGLELSGNALLMDAKYDNYTSAGVDLSGTPFYYLPQFKYSVTARYHMALPNDLGDLGFSAAYTWQRHLLKSSDFPPVAYLPSFGNLDLTVDWTNIVGQPVDAQFFMTNVTDNAVNVGGFGAYNALGLAANGVAPPRMFGFKFKYRF